MTGTPTPADFVENVRANEYEVRFRVSGEAFVTINADSEEEARQKAGDMACDPMFAPELDDYDDIEVEHVHKTPTMYLVVRDGKPMQVSHLNPGDEPRQPDERGF